MSGEGASTPSRAIGAAGAPDALDRLAQAMRACGLDADVSVLGVTDEIAAGGCDGLPSASEGGPELPATPTTQQNAHPPAGPRVSVRVHGHVALVGPVRVAGEAGPCGQCLARRWQALLPKVVRNALELGRGNALVNLGPYLGASASDVLLHVAQRLVADPGHVDRGLGVAHATVVQVNLLSLHTRSVMLVTDPQCPTCATAPASAAAAPLPLSSAPKLRPDTFRERSLDDLSLYEEGLINPVCGVLAPRAVPDYLSPTTASVSGVTHTRSFTRLQTYGWGGHTASYADSARVGIIEGLERVSSRARVHARPVTASLNELRVSGTRALDPRECGTYSEAFHTLDPARVPPFDEHRPIAWVWGRSLRDDSPVLIPELLTFYDAAAPAERFVQECSNGCASGSSLTEAVFHGLMELIERDAFLLTWYGGLQLPELDGSTSRSSGTRALIDQLALHGYRARFFDARLTFPVPVVIGVAERIDGKEGSLAFGAGASLAPEDALRAALAEIATDAPHLPRRVAVRSAELAAMAEDYDKVRRLDDHPILYGLRSMRRHADFLLAQAPRHALEEAYHDAPRPATDLRDDVSNVVAMLAESGFDTLVVDQTSPLQRQSGLHTASVIVPGLVPIDFGWSRQRVLTMPRLRTAPRLAGLVDRDLTDDDLNLVPHPFP